MNIGLYIYIATPLPIAASVAERVEALSLLGIAQRAVGL